MANMRKYLDILTESNTKRLLKESNIKNLMMQVEEYVDMLKDENISDEEIIQHAKDKFGEELGRHAEAYIREQEDGMTEDSIYPDADEYADTEHPNCVGNEKNGPAEVFGDDEVYEDLAHDKKVGSEKYSHIPGYNPNLLPSHPTNSLAIAKHKASTNESDWTTQFDETVNRMKKLAGIPVTEDSIYPDADCMDPSRHPNDEGNDRNGPAEVFGDDEIYGDEEGPLATHGETNNPGEHNTPTAPMKESKEIDEDGFSYKMAQAALDGKDEVEIGGKIFKVRMSKDKAQSIVGK